MGQVAFKGTAMFLLLFLGLLPPFSRGQWYREDGPSTPPGFGLREAIKTRQSRSYETATFADLIGRSMGGIMGTISPRVLNVTPRLPRTNSVLAFSQKPQTQTNTVRFPGRLAGKTTRRPKTSFASPTTSKSLSAFVTPLPQSFSDIFAQTKAPLVLNKETSPGKETSTKATALATLRAILDHVKKKEVRFEDEYDYYEDYYEYVDTKKSRFNNAKKPRPKIVPKQRVVPKKSKSKTKEKLQKEKKKFSSFVTQKPRTIGEILATAQERPVSKYNPKNGVTDIILPTIMIQGDPSDAGKKSKFANKDIVLPAIKFEEGTTRRIGYNYEPPLDEPRLNLPSSKESSSKPDRPELTPTIDYKAPENPLSNTLGSPPPSKKPNGSSKARSTTTNRAKPAEEGYSYEPPLDEPRLEYPDRRTTTSRPEGGYRAPNGPKLDLPQRPPTPEPTTSYIAPTVVVVENEVPPQEVTMEKVPSPTYSAPTTNITTKAPTTATTKATDQRPPTTGYVVPEEEQEPPENEQPPVIYEVEQPPVVIEVDEEEPPQPGYNNNEQPPEYDEYEDDEEYDYLQPPTYNNNQQPPTYNNQQPPSTEYQYDEEDYDSLQPPIYNDQQPRYNSGTSRPPSIFVTPSYGNTRPPIIIPPKTPPTYKPLPSYRPRTTTPGPGGFVSTLLPPLKTSTTPAYSRQLTQSPTSFSQLVEGSNRPLTSYQNNAPPPVYSTSTLDQQGKTYNAPEEDSYKAPEVVDNYDYLYDELTPPKESDDRPLGLDPRSKTTTTEVFIPDTRDSFEKSEKITLRNPVKEVEQTTKFQRGPQSPTFANIVDNSDSDDDPFVAPVSESPAPAFSTALIPTSTYSPPTTSTYRAPPTTSSYRAPPTTSARDDYGSPEGPVLTSSVSTGRPNTSYRPASSQPTQATYNQGNSGTRRPDQTYSTVVDASKIEDDKIEIDINVYVNDPTSETPPSNSHGPVSTYRTPEATAGYAAPTTGYNVEVGERPVDDGYGKPAPDDYSGPQKFDDILPQGQTEKYPAKKTQPKENKKKPNYPKSYGTKLNEDTAPYDYEAPDLYSGEGFDYLTDDIDSEYAVKPSFPTYIHPEPPDLHGDYDWTTEDDHAGDHYPEPEYVIEKPHHKHHKKPHKAVKPFYHKAPSGFHKPDPHHNPNPLGYHDSESYHHPEPIYDPDPYYEEDVYHDPKPYHEPKPYHDPKPYQEVKPYDKPDIYYKPDPYHEPPPYHEEPVYHEPPPYHEEPPVKYHEEPPYHKPPPHYKEPPYHEPPAYHEEPSYHEEPPYLEPPPYHEPEPHHPEPHEEFYEAPSYVSEPRPRGFPHHTEELLPELKDIIRPLDWNVHDFSSWRRLLDRTKNFGGSLSNRGPYGKKLYGHYEGGHKGELLNEVYDDPYEEPVYPKKPHYLPTSKPLYREETEVPLYNPPVEHYEEPYPLHEQYEDPYEEPSPYHEDPVPYYKEPEPYYKVPYYEEPNPYYDRPNPYDAPLYQYDTYQPYYPPEKPPKPFDISFDNWLDSSGIDSFGIPSTTVRSYSKSPYYVAYDHVGQGQPYRPYSYSPPSYNNQVETPFLDGDVGVPHTQPVSLNHQKQTPEVVYGQPLWPDQTARPPRKVGSIWAGLAKFANSLDEKNHYRGHGTGMVSMGSEDMEFAASIERPTFLAAPGGNITKSGVLQISDVSERDKDIAFQPQAVNRNETVDLTANLPSSANTSLFERSGPPSELTFLDYLFVDDKLVGATLAKMSDMLDAYFSDR